ncbi:MAG: hypothetical protein GXX85_18150, partial [Ignavibacteria bacterium]|nr:hypothetical protein [Ignavibacteria bacterium]
MNAFREAERKLGQESAIFKMPVKGQTVEPDPGTSKNIIQKIEDSKAWRAVIGNPEEGFGVSDMISDILVANPAAAATSGAGRAISTLAKRLVSPATQQIAKAGTKATQPITQAAEKLSKMTPEVAKTVARKGAGIGAAATGYETIKGATDPEYVNPITKQETFPSQFGASLRGGVGDTISMFGSAVDWKDMPEVGEKLKETGAKISEGYESKQVPFSWKSVFDPDWYANNLARSIPMTASLIPVMVAAYKGGKKAASLRGFGKYGQVIIASLAGSTASRPIESMLEAAGGYEEAKAMGKSESEADAIAQRIYDENLKLAGLDSAQLALSFMPTPVKTAGKLGKTAMTAGKFAVVGGTESAEEGYQGAIQARATGQDDRSILRQILNPTPELQEAMAIGGIFGLGMGGTGIITNMMQDIKTNTIANLPN